MENQGTEGAAGAAAAGEAGASNQGNDEMVPKSELIAAQQRAEHKSSLLDSSNAALAALNDAAGGAVTADQIKNWQEASQAAADIAQQKLIDEGKAGELLEQEKVRSHEALLAEQKRTNTYKSALRESELGRLAQDLLGKGGVVPEAAGAAVRALLDPSLAGADGAYLDLVQDESSGQFKPVLRVRGAGTAWPSDGQGENLTFEGHVERFKAANPYFFRPTVMPGAGVDGAGGSHSPAGQDAASIRSAVEKGDMETYQKNRAAIFGDPSLK